MINKYIYLFYFPSDILSMQYSRYIFWRVANNCLLWQRSQIRETRKVLIEQNGHELFKIFILGFALVGKRGNICDFGRKKDEPEASSSAKNGGALCKFANVVDFRRIIVGDLLDFGLFSFTMMVRLLFDFLM